MVHVYYGDGKGKTTAAMGLALRAFGAGKKVIIVQFLKGRPSAEITQLQRLGIQVFRLDRDYGFWKKMSDERKEIVRRQHEENLQRVIDAVALGAVDLLVLDEILPACLHQMADGKKVLELLKKASGVKDGPEIVCTGRLSADTQHTEGDWGCDTNPDDFTAEVLELADYVTKMKKEKHPFDLGISAREGIEW